MAGVTAHSRPVVPHWVRWVTWALLIADVVAFLIQGANRPPRPHLASAPASGPTTTTALTMSTAQLRVIPRPGQRLGPAHCFLLAGTPEARARGLSGRRDFGGYAGTVFVYASPSTDAYVMRNVHFPLSIAFFRGDGRFVSAAEMSPCPQSEATCPRYGAAGPFQVAVEVPAGRFAALGVGPGSAVQLGGPCSS